MGKQRIIYQDWIVELGRDPSLRWDEAIDNKGNYNRAIISAVNLALESLSNEESAFINAFYIRGISYNEISKHTGRAIYKLEAMHNRALKKLKNILPKLLNDNIKLPRPDVKKCPLCVSDQVEAINKLIRTKTKAETWRRIIRELKTKFEITISTPQRLIGHYKYHM